MNKEMEISNNINHAISEVFASVNFDTLTKRDAEFLQESLTDIQNLVEERLLKIKYNTIKPKRGDEIKEFWFIGETRAHCPRIEHRVVGEKGIQLIEISNVGHSYDNGHLSKVRVKGINEKGEHYEIYFTNVYVKFSEQFVKEYYNACKKHEKLISSIKNDTIEAVGKHCRYMDNMLGYANKRLMRQK